MSENHDMARCTVERLKRGLGLRLHLSDFTYVATWGSCTSPSSSTPMHGASLAGGYHGPRTRASCSTRWNRPSMTGGTCIAEASFITVTEAARAESSGRRRGGHRASVGSVRR